MIVINYLDNCLSFIFLRLLRGEIVFILIGCQDRRDTAIKTVNLLLRYVVPRYSDFGPQYSDSDSMYIATQHLECTDLYVCLSFQATVCQVKASARNA